MPTPGDFDVRELASSTRLNKLLKLTDAVGAFTGTPPPVGASSGYDMKAGYLAGTTSGSGLITVTFPSPFPTGLLGAWAISAAGGSQALWYSIDAAASTVAAAKFYALTGSSGGGTTVNSTSVAMMWLALGW